jgi:hypothetical protein
VRQENKERGVGGREWEEGVSREDIAISVLTIPYSYSPLPSLYFPVSHFPVGLFKIWADIVIICVDPKHLWQLPG